MRSKLHSRFLGASFVLLGLTPGLALAQVRPIPPILKLALSTIGSHRYVGTRVVEFRRDGDTVRRVEFVTGDGRKLRIEYPPESPQFGQIVVETPGERKEFIPGRNVIRVSESRDDEFGRLPMMIRRMGARVRVITGPAVTIAGRKGREVSITDAQGNVRQQMVIDNVNGMVLKRQLFDFVGTPTAGFTFTKISFREQIDPRLFRIVRNGAKVMNARDELRTLIQKRGFVNAAIDPSSDFKLESSRIMAAAGANILLQLYRGPQGRVSLFQTETEIDPARLRKFGNQEVRTLAWEQSDRHFALVGNVDAATLEALKRQLIITP